MSEKIGLLETVSIAVGGMVGWDICSVGVVAAGAGTAAWIGFAIAGFVARCAGYSFVRLNSACCELRSPIGQIQEVSESRQPAGMVGWLLTFGYVGTMAMYAVGSAVALLALLWNLHQSNPDVLVTVAVIWAVVLSVSWVPKRR